MNLQILPSALADLDRGKRFYAAFDPALGRHFLDSLLDEIDGLVHTAGIHIVVFGYHRLLSRRFPFAIYYQVTDGTCLVWRVLDCRQESSRLMTDLK